MNPLVLLGLVGLGALVVYETSSTASAAQGGPPPPVPQPQPAPGPVRPFPPASPQPTPSPAPSTPTGVSPMPLPYWPDTPQDWPGGASAAIPTNLAPGAVVNPDGTVTIGDVTYTPPTSGPSTPGWTPSQSHLPRYRPHTDPISAALASSAANVRFVPHTAHSPTMSQAHVGAFYDPMSGGWY